MTAKIVAMTEPTAAALADEVRDELMAVGLPVLPDQQYRDEGSSGSRSTRTTTASGWAGTSAARSPRRPPTP
jgi:hypothetical protein